MIRRDRLQQQKFQNNLLQQSRNMSRYNASRPSRSNRRTPYCKVCHDAGKSRAEYTSHFLRETPSRNSRVVCPTLLATVCRKCGQGGHMSSYCSQSTRSQSTRPRRTTRIQSRTDRDGFQTRNMEASWRLARKLSASPAQSDTQSIATTESSFSALSLDDEDDSNSEFPALNPQEFTWKPSTATSTVSRPTLKTGQSWAQVANVESHSLEQMDVKTPTSPFVPFSGSVSNWSDDSTPRSPFESGRSEIIMQEILDRKDNKKRWGDD